MEIRSVLKPYIPVAELLAATFGPDCEVVLHDLAAPERSVVYVANPSVTGRKIGAYYGCMLLRPSREMQFDDPENPKMLEDFIRAIGAEPVIYAQRNECCGGYMAVENRSYAAKQAQKIMDNAKAQGAELLITACPLCSYNLLHNTDGALPVVYFTELLAEALGCGEEDA